MISIAIPYFILTTLHYTAGLLGLLYAAGALATAIFGFIIGHLTDLWGRKKTLIVVELMLPSSLLLLVLSTHLGVLFLASMLGGYSATGSLLSGGAGGAVQPIQGAIIADLTIAETRTKYFSTFAFLNGVFGALGALLAGAFSIHRVFLAAMIISFFGFPFVLLMNLKDARGSFRHLPSKVVIGKFTLTGALNGITQGLVTPFLIPFFLLVYGVPKSEMAVYGSIAGGLGAVSLLTAPHFERKLGFVKAIAATRGLGAMLLILMPLWRFFPFALLVYLITPALRISAVPAQQTALTDMVSADERGRALGSSQVARLSGSSGAVALTGYLFRLDEIGLPFYLYGALTGVTIVLYFRFFGSAARAFRAEEIER